MHVSLDSALGRQRRLNQVGESITQIAPDPAAAYSLRSLTGGDPKVVRVRRGSDNDEQDFTASEVASGAMLSYVNTQAIKPLDIKELVSTGRDGDFILAKAAYSLRSLGTRQATIPNDAAPLNADTVVPASGKYVVQVRRNVNGDQKSFTADEVADGTLLSFVNESFTSSLPLDVQGSAAAAYSLRNLSSSYSGNVVEVRRSSNNDTQNFTANEVTDGTLLSFVNNDLSIKQTTISNSNSYDSTSGTGTLTSSTSLGFTASGASSLVVSKSGFPQDFSVLAGKIKVTYNASGLTGGARILARNTAGSSSGDAITVSNGTGNTGTTTLTGETNLFIFDGLSGSDISLEITSLEIIGDGFVETWYDQSGNGRNATQPTNHFQPKIVSAGAVLVDSAGKPEIDFDGSNDALNTSSGFTLTSSDDLSLFVVSEVEDASATKVILSQDNGTGTGRSWIEYRTTQNFATSLSGGGPHQFGPYSITEKNLLSLIYDDSAGTIDAFGDGSQSGSQLTSKTVEAASGVLNIGESKDGAAFFDGTMQELIIYVSDQTDKRRALEESISGHYGITLGSFNRDGFVRTWYDQSVTGQDATTGTPNANHAVQTSVSSMPQIVENGNLITGGGIDFDDDQLDFTALNATDLAIFSVVKFDDVSGQQRILGDSSDNSEGFGIGNATNGFFRGNGGSSLSPSLGATISTSGDFLYSLTRASDTITFFTKGVASGTNTRSDAFKANSIGGSTNPIDGKVKEIVIYETDQTDNRTAIEANIGSVYSIDLPSGVDPGFDQVDGFVETWYDQSGNGNNVTQATAGSQPKIVNAGALVTQGGKPNIDFSNSTFLSVSSFTIANASGHYSAMFVGKRGTDTSGRGFWGVQSQDRWGLTNTTGTNEMSVATVTATGYDTTSTNLHSQINDGTDTTIFRDGSQVATGTTDSGYTSPSTQTLRVGSARFDSRVIEGEIQELIIYNSDETSTRTALETNINGHYSIF